MKAEIFYKWQDCIKCLCIDCKMELKTDIDKCEYSDCEWCKNEKGNHIDRCNSYIEKGGSYNENKNKIF